MIEYDNSKTAGFIRYVRQLPMIDRRYRITIENGLPVLKDSSDTFIKCEERHVNCLDRHITHFVFHEDTATYFSKVAYFTNNTGSTSISNYA